MLLCVQIPFVDYRNFIKNSGKLSVPNWPVPIPNEEFVRSLGPVSIRRAGGLNGWVGENYHCIVTKNFKFDKIVPFTNKQGKKIQFRVAYKRLYFDGLAVGKLEIGLSTDQQLWFDLLDSEEIRLLVQHILAQNLVLSWKDRRFTKPLIHFGRYLANQYMRSSTKHGEDFSNIEDWWVEACTPLVFILSYNVEVSEVSGAPFYAKKTTARPQAPDLRHDWMIPRTHIWHWWQMYDGKSIPVWHIIQDKLNEPRFLDFTRKIRMLLMRLHAENECLKRVLRHIAKGNISADGTNKQGDMLQRYLNDATKRIARIEKSYRKETSQEVLDIAKELEDEAYPGQRCALLEKLDEQHVRKNVRDKVLNLIDQVEQKTGDTYIYTEGVTISKYNISGGQQGSVGDYASVTAKNFNQVWQEASNETDLDKLKGELRYILREYEKGEINGDSESLERVANAAEAAESGDGRKAVKFLAPIASWLSDVSKKVAVPAVVKIIEILMK